MFNLVKADLSIQRSFLFWSWDLAYEATIQIEKSHCGTILDALIKSLIGKKILNEKQSIDLSGLPNLNDNHPAQLYFLRASGQLQVGDTEFEAFKVKLESPFLKFSGVHHIVHEIKEFVSEFIPSFVKVKNIGRAIPLTINEFSFGLQSYESKYTVFLGYSPVSKDRLLINYQEGALKIVIEADSMKKKDQLPLSKFEILENLNKITQDLLKFNLIDDLKARAANA